MVVHNIVSVVNNIFLFFIAFCDIESFQQRQNNLLKFGRKAQSFLCIFVHFNFNVSDLTFEHFYILFLFMDDYIKYVIRLHEVMYSYA